MEILLRFLAKRGDLNILSATINNTARGPARQRHGAQLDMLYVDSNDMTRPQLFVGWSRRTGGGDFWCKKVEIFDDFVEIHIDIAAGDIERIFQLCKPP